MITVQIDSLSGILDVVADDPGLITDRRPCHDNSGPLLPCVGIIRIPCFLTDDLAFLVILPDILAKPILRFDLRSWHKVVFADSIAFDQCPNALIHTDASAVGTVKRIAPVFAGGSIINADSHVISDDAVADAGTSTFAKSDNCGACLIV